MLNKLTAMWDSVRDGCQTGGGAQVLLLKLGAWMDGPLGAGTNKSLIS